MRFLGSIKQNPGGRAAAGVHSSEPRGEQVPVCLVGLENATSTRRKYSEYFI